MSVRTRANARRAVLIGSVVFAAALSARAEQAVWPDLSSPPTATGGGEHDAAVIVGAENYAFVAKVPGARQNAQDWQAYLTDARKIPLEKVALLRDNEATLEELEAAAGKAAAQVEAGGTLWFVFIGHGAPSKDGKDGLLVGADAQQRADSLYARSLSREKLLSLLDKGQQAHTLVLIDACFSGRTSAGGPLVAGLQPLIISREALGRLDGRVILMTAAKSDQFAGPLPKSSTIRPAFSYLALGALRGWAADLHGNVTAAAVVEYASKALSLAHDRTQTPELSGAGNAVIAVGHEKSPSLSKLDRQNFVSDSGSVFKISELPSIPKVNTPEVLHAQASNLELEKVDVDALEKYEAAATYDKSDASPEEKAANWHQFYLATPQFSVTAKKREEEWKKFAAQIKARNESRLKRIPARDQDWGKLHKLLSLSVVPENDKRRWSTQFVATYGDSPGVDHEMAQALLSHVAPGPVEHQLKKILALPEDMAFSGAKFPTSVYESPKKDFSVAIPGAWSSWAISIDQKFSEYIFSDYSNQKRKLLLLWYRQDFPHSRIDGAAEIFPSVSEFVSDARATFGVGIIEGPTKLKISGRDFYTLAGDLNGLAPSREEGQFASCHRSVSELCGAGYYRYAVLPVADGFYVLIGISETAVDLPGKSFFREFVRSFSPVKAGPEGAVLSAP